MDIKFDRLQKSDRDNLVMVSQRWLRPVLRKFCKTTTSLIFLERLVDDTLLFGKFQDSESIRKMNAPQLKAARIPIERSQSWFYDARTQLMNARLLWVNSNPLHLPNALHTVNFPGMADILIQYLKYSLSVLKSILNYIRKSTKRPFVFVYYFCKFQD